MKSQEMHNRDRHGRDRIERADPKALATARELALLLPNDAVMLFGSRARGDHRPDSDMDHPPAGAIPPRRARKSTSRPHIEEAGNQAAARIYGQNPHPEVQVVPMRTGTYQRTKHSRNLMAAHIAADMILAEGDPKRWNRNPGDFSAEPIFARRSALEALQATTVINEWRIKYPEEEDDLVLKAQEAMSRGTRRHSLWRRPDHPQGRENTIHPLPAETTGTEAYPELLYSFSSTTGSTEKTGAPIRQWPTSSRIASCGQTGCGTDPGNRPCSPQVRQSPLELLEEIKEKRELKPKAKTPHSGSDEVYPRGGSGPA